MRTVKTVTIPATPETTKEVEDKTLCDLCGREAPGHSIQGVWGDDSYTVADVEVSMKMGNSYPEGGSSKTHTFDVCPECFAQKLVPWMQSQGATPRVEEVDW